MHAYPIIIIHPRNPIPTLTCLRSKKSRLLGRLNWCGWHISDLLDQKLPFINELLILGSVLQKVFQESQQSLSIDKQDLLYRNGFVRIRNEHFENVEALVLYHLSVITQQIHAYLEMLASVNIRSHHRIIRPV